MCLSSKKCIEGGVYDVIKKICEDNENWEKTVRLSDKEWAGLFGNTADRMKLHDAVVEKNFYLSGWKPNINELCL